MLEPMHGGIQEYLPLMAIKSGKEVYIPKNSRAFGTGLQEASLLWNHDSTLHCSQPSSKVSKLVLWCYSSDQPPSTKRIRDQIQPPSPHNMNILQYIDGTQILNINRDDQAGFRLDTMTTHHQYTTPSIKGKEALTTHTAYVNRYPSVIQTTSYNFTGTNTTKELCAGVTKAQSLFMKCPAQHSTDMAMLSKKEELREAFVNPVSSEEKSIAIVYVWMVPLMRVRRTMNFSFIGLNGTCTGKRLQCFLQPATVEQVT